LLSSDQYGEYDDGAGNEQNDVFESSREGGFASFPAPSPPKTASINPICRKACFSAGRLKPPSPAKTPDAPLPSFAWVAKI
jgi:hypothetical protein